MAGFRSGGFHRDGGGSGRAEGWLGLAGATGEREEDEEPGEW